MTTITPLADQDHQVPSELKVDAESIREVRRFTDAGISDCRDALVASKGDLYSAIRSLITPDQILAAKRSFIATPPPPEEAQLMERLYNEVVVPTEPASAELPDGWERSSESFGDVEIAAAWQTVKLPSPIESYARLVRLIWEAEQDCENRDDLITSVRALGFSESDAAIVVDRYEDGYLRWSNVKSMISVAPSRRGEPITYAAYCHAQYPRWIWWIRKWWRSPKD